ncbi:MAG: response regulator [Clostridiales bacterium]|nr:response regulator [Clostridiales bacterium]
MLRVLLVDDEPLALEGLKVLIDWQAEGFAICGECASAAETLKMLPDAKPDLIVTDIRMPGMSGLELLNAARQAGFDGQFIIVSGYSDFQYAKKALQLGVAGYLLKPVEPADAAVVLSHVRSKLFDRETEAGQRQNAIQRAIGEMLVEGRVSNNGVPATARWVLATWGSPLPYPALQAMLALFKDDEATIHIVEDKEYLVLRQKAGEETQDFNRVKALLKQHHRRLNVSEPTETPTMLFSLRKQLADRLDGACRRELGGHVDRLVHAIALRQTDEGAEHCARLETFCAACGTHTATHARRQLISAISGLLKDRDEALKTFLCAQDADFQTLCRLAIELLAPAQERVSDRMEHYAREHAGERITLSGVAAALKYNPTYLGRKFIEERGICFREWLIELRMAESAKLLRGTNLSVNAVAKSVGYEYYKRFLKHFKRRYSAAPEQYRRQKL